MLLLLLFYHYHYHYHCFFYYHYFFFFCSSSSSVFVSSFFSPFSFFHSSSSSSSFSFFPSSLSFSSFHSSSSSYYYHHYYLLTSEPANFAREENIGKQPQRPNRPNATLAWHVPQAKGSKIAGCLMIPVARACLVRMGNSNQTQAPGTATAQAVFARLASTGVVHAAAPTLAPVNHVPPTCTSLSPV